MTASRAGMSPKLLQSSPCLALSRVQQGGAFQTWARASALRGKRRWAQFLSGVEIQKNCARLTCFCAMFNNFCLAPLSSEPARSGAPVVPPGLSGASAFPRLSGFRSRLPAPLAPSSSTAPFWNRTAPLSLTCVISRGPSCSSSCFEFFRALMSVLSPREQL